ncbi:MAG TPA: hypothetical protein VG389_10865 [Myxococcota bacterium]|jgi:hypothetical protein|nr:hypothetical protein [Myxococcota bacterium]
MKRYAVAGLGFAWILGLPACQGCGSRNGVSDGAAGNDAAATDGGGGGGGDAGDSGAATDAGGTSADSGAGNALAEWCATVAAGACGVIFSCCDAAAQADNGGSEAACESMLVTDCMGSGIGGPLAAGTTVLDPARLADCDAQLTALAASCDIDVNSVLFLTCLRAFVGQQPEGGTCTVLSDLEWLECADGTCVGGTCQPWLQSGDDCVGVAGQQCDLVTLRCIDDGLGGGTCGAPLADGTACINDEACVSLYCDPATSQCAPSSGTLVCNSF